MKKYILLIVALLIFTICSANTYIVPDDYSTIQTAIDSANINDTVLVKYGQYNEDIDLQKSIDVKKYGSTRPVIKGTGAVTRVVFIQGDVTFSGFEITTSDSTQKGIMCRSSSSDISISDCLIDSVDIGIYNEDAKLSITDCDIGYCYGYGLKLTWGLVELIGNDAESGINNCNIHDNTSGIMIRQGHKSDSELKICNSKIMNNEHKGVYCGMTTDPVFEENLICSNGSNNYDCGIYVNAAFPDIINNTFYGNHYGIVVVGNSYVEVVNTIIWNSDQQSINSYAGSISVTYSCIEGGWSGTGNIDTDPLFVDPRDDDFGLQWNSSNFSPCIDTGDPDMDWDSDDTPPDMGYEKASNHDYFYDQYDESCLDSIDWLSFPVLNRTTNGYTEALGLLHRQGLIDTSTNIYNDAYLEKVVFQNSDDIYYQNNMWNNELQPDSCFHSHLGYKFVLQSPYDSVEIGVSGTWKDPSDTVSLYAEQSNWIGCFLEEPTSISDAFSSIEDFLEGVQSEHWSIKYPNPLISPSWTVNPGELYIIDVDEDCELVWDDSKGGMKPYIREMTDYFVYKEKLDYMAVNVDTVFGNKPQEIAVYNGDECLGASKVKHGFPVQILAYTPDGGSKDDLTFMLYYGGSKDKAVSDYTVYSNKLSAYIEKPLDYKAESLVTVRLNTKDEPEPQLKFGLFGNYPNPVAAGVTNISFAPAQGAEQTEIKIYNVKGQLVRKLDCSQASPKAGLPTISWDCRDSRGNQVKSGVYFYKLISDEKSAVKKMLILR